LIIKILKNGVLLVLIQNPIANEKSLLKAVEQKMTNKINFSFLKMAFLKFLKKKNFK
jgi:hypothetical protein